MTSIERQSQLRQRVESSPIPDILFREYIPKLAFALVEQSKKIQFGENVLLWFDPLALPLVKEINNLCISKGAQVSLFMRDLEEDARIIPALDAKGIHDYFNEEEVLVGQADKIIIIRCPENPQALASVPVGKRDLYFSRYSQVHSRRHRESDSWVVFDWPTEYEAQRENLNFTQYFQAVMEGYFQPWERIQKAQAKLKKILDEGEILEFHANEDDPDKEKQTHLKMSIKGMTFFNATVGINFPGAELFSAPLINSAEGQMYAPGYYIYNNGLMKNIYLKMKEGKIIEASAEEGNDVLQAILNRDEGARFIGETAIATNRGLRKRFLNTQLGEKPAGSFHIGIGRCYSFNRDENGDPINVSNGNISSIHWDLSIMMIRNPDNSGGGRIVLDDRLIQEDGLFVDEDLFILNPASQMIRAYVDEVLGKGESSFSVMDADTNLRRRNAYSRNLFIRKR